MRILFADDEKILSTSVAKKLEQSGYSVDVIHSLKEYSGVNTDIYSLLMIDISLKDGSGFDIIKDVRNNKTSNVPIIIISGHESLSYKVEGLDIGADDYITKPFLPEELLARVRSAIRRNNNTADTSYISYNNIAFNLTTREVEKGGNLVEFTKKEKQIIEYFLFHKNELISKRQLVEALWSAKDRDYVTDNTINVTMYKVRKKLGEDFKLETKIGEGYILEA